MNSYFDSNKFLNITFEFTDIHPNEDASIDFLLFTRNMRFIQVPDRSQKITSKPQTRKNRENN